jgi:hypothetical protein
MSQFNKRVQNRDEQQTYSDAIGCIWLDASDDRTGGKEIRWCVLKVRGRSVAPDLL